MLSDPNTHWWGLLLGRVAAAVAVGALSIAAMDAIAHAAATAEPAASPTAVSSPLEPSQ